MAARDSNTRSHEKEEEKRAIERHEDCKCRYSNRYANNNRQKRKRKQTRTKTRTKRRKTKTHENEKKRTRRLSLRNHIRPPSVAAARTAERIKDDSHAGGEYRSARRICRGYSTANRPQDEYELNTNLTSRRLRQVCSPSSAVDKYRLRASGPRPPLKRANDESSREAARGTGRPFHEPRRCKMWHAQCVSQRSRVQYRRGASGTRAQRQAEQHEHATQRADVVLVRWDSDAGDSDASKPR